MREEDIVELDENGIEVATQRVPDGFIQRCLHDDMKDKRARSIQRHKSVSSARYNRDLGAHEVIKLPEKAD